MPECLTAVTGKSNVASGKLQTFNDATVAFYTFEKNPLFFEVEDEKVSKLSSFFVGKQTDFRDDNKKDHVQETFCGR